MFKTVRYLTIAAVCVCNFKIVQAAEHLPEQFTTPLFNCHLGSNRYGDGFSSLQFSGRDLGSFVGTYLTLRNEKGEVFRCREKSSSGITDGISLHEELGTLSFATVCPLKDPDGNIHAEIRRHYHFSSDKIEMQATLTAIRDITIAETWLIIDLILIPTPSLIGAIVEGTTFGSNGVAPQTLSTLIPEVYSKDKWGLKTGFANLKLKIGDNVMEIIAGEKTSAVSINHYGGSHIEISIRPKVHYGDTHYPRGATLSWSSSLHFIKQ